MLSLARRFEFEGFVSSRLFRHDADRARVLRGPLALGLCFVRVGLRGLFSGSVFIDGLSRRLRCADGLEPDLCAVRFRLGEVYLDSESDSCCSIEKPDMTIPPIIITI